MKKAADLWTEILHEDVVQNWSKHQLSQTVPTVNSTPTISLCYTANMLHGTVVDLSQDR